MPHALQSGTFDKVDAPSHITKQAEGDFGSSLALHPPQDLRDNRRDPWKGPLILIPYITLIYPLYSLTKPLHNPKGPFKDPSCSPLKNDGGES